jgi:Asp-tRNA(Asn)/Glu-tRNA(Gln) amidotransferase A subunit family amidase
VAADARGDWAMSELQWMTAAQAAQAIAARQLSPVELMSALLERIGRLEPKLHIARNGLPLSVQFVGRYFAETTLFQVAREWERAAGTNEKHPHLV